MITIDWRNCGVIIDAIEQREDAKMASKLYKAVDKNNGTLSRWLVSNRGVAVTSWALSDYLEIYKAIKDDEFYVYDDIERFNDAVDPILIAEW